MSSTTPEAPFPPFAAEEETSPSTTTEEEAEPCPPMIDGEVDAMKKMFQILEPFPQEVRLRALKYVAARFLGWTGCRLEETLLHYTEVASGKYA